MRHATVPLTLACILALGSVQAAAQPRPLSPPETRRLFERWDAEMKRIDALLVAEDGKKAYRRSERLLREMADRLIAGDSVDHLLGITTVLRALAAYKLDRPDEALWHWHVAHQLFPAVRELTMNAYGEAGPFLKERPPRTKLVPPEELRRRAGEMTPPKKLRSPQPDFPSAKQGQKPVAVTVQAVIGRDGSVREPLIIDSQGELTLVCVTLDALRSWKYQPAELDGEPVEVYFNLTVDFRSR